jgi:solute carrier family 45 protein 1/2/4
MIFGSFVVAFCLIVLGWTAEIVGLFVQEPEKAKNVTIALAVSSIYAVDFSINVGMWDGSVGGNSLTGL